MSSLRLRLALAAAPLLAGSAGAQCLLDQTVASDADQGDWYGSSVSAWGRWVITGSEYADAGGFDHGQVYVLERVGDQWVEHSILGHADADFDDRFGHAAAIRDGRIVAGARYNADFGYGTGAAYVFEFDGTAWNQTAKLLPPDAGQADFVGGSVDVDGDLVVVGAHGQDSNGNSNSGAAYVFEYDGSAWVQVDKLISEDSEPGDRFGERVAMWEDRIVLGAIAEDGTGSKQGAAYVFERGDDGQWFQAAKLTAFDVEDFDRFGSDVDIYGDRVVVGSALSGEFFEGSVYVFERATDGTWNFLQKLESPAPQENAHFGHDVSIFEGRLLATSINQDKGAINASGAAFLYERQADGLYGHVATLVDKVGGNAFQFGNSADLFRDLVAVGMRGSEAGAGYNSGALLLYGGGGTTTEHLDGCPGELSISAGGSQSLELWAGSENAGLPYLVLGSFDRAEGSVVVGGVEIPLTFDAYFSMTLDPGAVSPLVDGSGTLDDQGRASARFDLPAGSPPAAAGLALRHAFVVIDPTSLALSLVSDAVDLQLVD